MGLYSCWENRKSGEQHTPFGVLCEGWIAMTNVHPCVSRMDPGPTILSQLLGLLEKRREHLWSPLGAVPTFTASSQ